jgi:hypothetical protein
MDDSFTSRIHSRAVPRTGDIAVGGQKDEAGVAGTTPIAVAAPTGSTGETIDKVASPFVLNSNFESITFQCDGAGNWLVE